MTVEEAATALSGDTGKQDEAAEEVTEKAEPVEGEEEDAQPETEEDTPEPEDDDEDDEQPTYAVKVAGKEVKVKLNELIKSYQLEGDYTRKNQQVAEVRKAAEAALATATAERERYVAGIQQIEQVLIQTTPQRPNPDHYSDSMEYLKADRAWQGRMDHLQSLAAERQRIEEVSRTEQDRAARELVERGMQELVEAIPEWKDEKRASTEKAELIKYGLSRGYTADELSGITDHRAILILRKAWMHDQMQAQAKTLRPVPQPGPVKPAPPGNGIRQPANSYSRAFQRLAKSGSVEDAAAAIGRMK